jgi:hypothetical protein
MAAIEDHSREIPLPPIDKKLLDALDDRFPPAPPLLDDSERVIWLKTGQRAIVEWLHSVYNQQQEDQEDVF